MPEPTLSHRTDRLLLGVTADRIRHLLEDRPAGMSEDTRLGLDAALVLLEQDVRALEAVNA